MSNGSTRTQLSYSRYKKHKIASEVVYETEFPGLYCLFEERSVAVGGGTAGVKSTSNMK